MSTVKSVIDILPKKEKEDALQKFHEVEEKFGSLKLCFSDPFDLLDSGIQLFQHICHIPRFVRFKECHTSTANSPKFNHRVNRWISPNIIDMLR